MCGPAAGSPGAASRPPRRPRRRRCGPRWPAYRRPLRPYTRPKMAVRSTWLMSNDVFEVYDGAPVILDSSCRIAKSASSPYPTVITGTRSDDPPGGLTLGQLRLELVQRQTAGRVV